MPQTKAELDQLIQKLEAGEASTEEYAQALAFAKSLADKQPPAKPQGKQEEDADDDAEGDDPDTPDADADADDDTDEADADDESGDPDDEEDVDADDTDAEPPAGKKGQPVRKSVTEEAAPEEDVLHKSLADAAEAQDTDVETLFDAYPLIQAMAEAYGDLAAYAKSMNALVETLQAERADVAQLRTDVAGLREELAQAQGVFKSLTPPAPAQPDAGQSELAEQLRALQGRYEDLEKAVSSRPASPHPRQGPAKLPGAEATLTKDQTLDLLDKSYSKGDISEEEYFRTSALLDHAQRARASFVEVVRANAPGALPLIKSVLEL